MFVYALAQPIDFFDGLIPLPRWIAEDPDSNTAWALRATLALADARAEAGWTGGMRHLPSIGALPVPGTAELFMVIKQDTGGTCFVVSTSPQRGCPVVCAVASNAKKSAPFSVTTARPIS